MNEVEWHALDKKEVLKELDSNEKGISNKEAEIRLKKYGLNELKQTSRISVLKILLLQK